MKRGRPAKYPFRSCEDIGDSFFIPMVTKSDFRQALGYWNKTLAPLRFEMEKEFKDGAMGLRVKRTQ